MRKCSAAHIIYHMKANSKWIASRHHPCLCVPLLKSMLPARGCGVWQLRVRAGSGAFGLVPTSFCPCEQNSLLKSYQSPCLAAFTAGCSFQFTRGTAWSNDHIHVCPLPRASMLGQPVSGCDMPRDVSVCVDRSLGGISPTLQPVATYSGHHWHHCLIPRFAQMTMRLHADQGLAVSGAK